MPEPAIGEGSRTAAALSALRENEFDAVIHFDETRALEPLNHGTRWAANEVPETYPTGT